MDLSLVETYFYLLMVVALFTAPVTIGLLAFGLFKGFFLRVLAGIAIGLPALALMVQFGIFLQDETEKREYRQQDTELERLFGPTIKGRLIDGHLVGFKEVYGRDYAQYQFALPEFSPLMLDILVPPTNVTSGATIKLAESLPPLEVAHLVIQDSSMLSGPMGRTPAVFFGEEFPLLAEGLKSDRVLMLHLTARHSQVTYYSGEADKYPWRSQSAFLQMKGFAVLSR
jgi:hypothetical protein